MSSSSSSLPQQQQQQQQQRQCHPTARAKMTHLSLSSILSACIDASLKGCFIIQSYAPSLAGRGTTSGSLKEAGDVKSIMTKADVEAQKIIVSSLYNTFGSGIRIIGEEDDTCSTAAASADDDDASSTTALRMDLLPPYKNKEKEEPLPLSELTIFVDPLDGTREFVEGRLQNVACLIGVADLNGRALAGAVGIPFPSYHSDDDGMDEANLSPPCVHYGLVGGDVTTSSFHGVYPPPVKTEKEAQLPNNDQHEQSIPLAILTGDSTNPILQRATQKALSLASSNTNSPPIHVVIGGTASKLLETSKRQNAISILHFKTSLWDTCATEALLCSQGGKITDLFGSLLSHSANNRKNKDIDIGYGNVWGVVASGSGSEASLLHEELCRCMRADYDAIDAILGRWRGNTNNLKREAQAVDVARDLDGFPLSREWIEQHLADYCGAAYKLRGYSVPEASAVRMMMSTGARILLDWEKIDNDDDNKQEIDGNSDDQKDKEGNNTHQQQQQQQQQHRHPPPESLFFKLIVMSDLHHARSKLQKAPHKLIRDVHSYQVECNFLTSDACQYLIQDAKIHVNSVYGSDLRPVSGENPKDLIQSRFAMLLEDFASSKGWRQQWLLDGNTARETLEVFARMHAYFWTGSTFWNKQGGKLGRDLEKVVWPNGGYMQPALQGMDQLEKVDKGWKKRLPSIMDELKSIPELKNVDLESIGERVQLVAKVVGKQAHPFASTGVDTTTHDDFLPYKTFIHGDPKQANVFLRQQDNGGGEEEKLDVGLIDFQWCGFGLAATDVAHHIAAALHGSCLLHEDELLNHYYSCLVDALVEFGVASSKDDVQERVFPRAVFQSQYETALVDICRMVFAYAWQRLKIEDVPTSASVNRNSYNKSIDNVKWLVKRCSELLSKREDEWLAHL